MSKDCDATNVSRRGFLLGGSSFAATGYLVIGKTSTEAVRTPGPYTSDYEVTIDSRPCPQNPPIYTVVPAVPDPLTLTVDPKQVVTWKAKTSGNHHRLAVLFLDDTPFLVKNSTQKVYAFGGSEADEGNGIGINAWIDPSAKQWDTFEYYVGVWDDDAKTTCTNDPTIMIGKGGNLNIGSAIAKLRAAERLLKKAAVAYPVESADIKSIEAQVNDLINKLKNPPAKK